MEKVLNRMFAAVGAKDKAYLLSLAAKRATKQGAPISKEAYAQ